MHPQWSKRCVGYRRTLPAESTFLRSSSTTQTSTAICRVFVYRPGPPTDVVRLERVLLLSLFPVSSRRVTTDTSTGNRDELSSARALVH